MIITNQRLFVLRNTAVRHWPLFTARRAGSREPSTLLCRDLLPPLQLRGGSLICRRHQAPALPSCSPSKHLLFSCLRHLHQDLEIIVHSKYLGLRVLSVHGILSKQDLWLRNCEGIVLTFYPSYRCSPRQGSTLKPRSFLSLPLTQDTVFTGQSYAIIQTL